MRASLSAVFAVLSAACQQSQAAAVVSEDVALIDKMNLYVNCLNTVDKDVFKSRDNYLLFSDVPENKIWRLSNEGKSAYREASNGANGNTFDVQGRLYSCESKSRRVTRTDKKRAVEVLADLQVAHGVGPFVRLVAGSGTEADVITISARRIGHSTPPVERPRIAQSNATIGAECAVVIARSVGLLQHADQADARSAAELPR